jgi:hypothetical protein
MILLAVVTALNCTWDLVVRVEEKVGRGDTNSTSIISADLNRKDMKSTTHMYDLLIDLDQPSVQIYHMGNQLCCICGQASSILVVFPIPSHPLIIPPQHTQYVGHVLRGRIIRCLTIITGVHCLSGNGAAWATRLNSHSRTFAFRLGEVMIAEATLRRIRHGAILVHSDPHEKTRTSRVARASINSGFGSGKIS